MKFKRLLMALMMSLLLTSCNNDSSSSTTSSSSTEQSLKEKYDCITIQEALDIAKNITSETSERYYVYGIVKSITDPKYGAMIIKDDTAEISVYNVKSSDGKVIYSDMENKPEVNDEVVLYSTLNNYNGTLEIHSGYLIEFKKGEASYDINDYKSMTIAEARNEKKRIKGHRGRYCSTHYLCIWLKTKWLLYC